MKHFNFRFAAMLVAVLTAVGFSANAQRTYYICCDSNGWPTILKDNESLFVGYTLTETAPESNVFKGTIYLSNNYKYDWVWMRIHSQLWEPDSRGGVPDYGYNARKVLVPGSREFRATYRRAAGESDGILMNTIGAGVYTLPMFYEEVCNPSKYDYNFSLRVPVKSGANGYFDVTYDQNAEMLTIVSQESANAVIFDGDPEPSLETWSKLLTDGTSRYVDAKDVLNFRYYNLAKNTYYGNTSSKTYTPDGKKIGLSTLRPDGNPYVMNGWPGGVFNLQGKALYQSPDNADVEHSGEYGKDYLYLYYADDAFVPTLNMTPGVEKSLTAVKLMANGDGTFSADIVADPKVMFRVIKALGATPETNTVWGPVGDSTLTLVDADGLGLATATAAAPASAGWWKFPKDYAKNLHLTFDTVNNQLKIEMPNDACAYLIGSPGGWTNPSSSNAEFYEAWKLQATDKGYYGCFDIADSDVNFRFSDALEGWTTCAFASYPDDFYEEFLNYSDGIKLHYVPGMGNWHFTDWPGGKMYIFINTTDRTITISQNPIPDSGIIGGRPALNPVCETTELAVYDVDSYIYEDQLKMGSTTHFFSEKSPYAKGEPKWYGTNALIPVGEPAEFNEYGVAEQAFEYSEGESTSEHLFKVPSLKNAYNMYVNRTIIDKKDKKIYYIAYINNHMLPGDQPELAPDHKTVADFSGHILTNVGTSAIVDVPAGKFDYCFHNLVGGVRNIGTEEVDFSNGVVNSADPNYGFYMHRVIAPTWEGGKVAVTPMKMMKFDDNVKVIAYNDYNIRKTLAKTADGVFEGVVELTYSDGANNYLGMYLQYGDNENDVIDIASTVYSNYMVNAMYNEGANILRFVDNKAEADFGLSISSTYQFRLFYPSGTKVKVKVDFNTMKLNLEVDGESVDPLMLTYADGSRTRIAPYYSVDKLFYSSANYNMEEFTIQNSDGKYLMPTATAMAPARRSVRGLPAADAYGISKFNYEFSETPYYWTAPIVSDYLNAEYVTMEFDIKSQTAYVQHTGKASNWFVAEAKVIPDGEWYYDYVTTSKTDDFETFGKDTDDLMTQTAPGVYRGAISFKDADRQAVAIYKGIRFTHTPILFDTVDLCNMEEGDSKTYYVRNDYVGQGFSEVACDDPNASYYVELNENDYTLTFTRSKEASVDEIASSDGVMKVRAVNGGLLVEASEVADLTVFNLQGIAVVKRVVAPGETFIALPAGLYIANGAKIFCR